VGGADAGELIECGGDDGEELAGLFDIASEIIATAVEDVGGSGHGFAEFVRAKLYFEVNIGLGGEEFAQRGRGKELTGSLFVIALDGKAVVEIREAGLHGGQIKQLGAEIDEAVVVHAEAKAIETDEESVDPVVERLVTPLRPMLVNDEPLTVGQAGFEVKAEEGAADKVGATATIEFEAAVDELAAGLLAELLPDFLGTRSKQTAEGGHAGKVAGSG